MGWEREKNLERHGRMRSREPRRERAVEAKEKPGRLGVAPRGRKRV